MSAGASDGRGELPTPPAAPPLVPPPSAVPGFAGDPFRTGTGLDGTTPAGVSAGVSGVTVNELFTAYKCTGRYGFHHPRFGRDLLVIRQAEQHRKGFFPTTATTTAASQCCGHFVTICLHSVWTYERGRARGDGNLAASMITEYFCRWCPSRREFLAKNTKCSCLSTSDHRDVRKQVFLEVDSRAMLQVFEARSAQLQRPLPVREQDPRRANPCSLGAAVRRIFLADDRELTETKALAIMKLRRDWEQHNRKQRPPDCATTNACEQSTTNRRTSTPPFLLPPPPTRANFAPLPNAVAVRGERCVSYVEGDGYYPVAAIVPKPHDLITGRKGKRDNDDSSQDDEYKRARPGPMLARNAMMAAQTASRKNAAIPPPGRVKNPFMAASFLTAPPRAALPPDGHPPGYRQMPSPPRESWQRRSDADARLTSCWRRDCDSHRTQQETQRLPPRPVPNEYRPVPAPVPTAENVADEINDDEALARLLASFAASRSDYDANGAAERQQTRGTAKKKAAHPTPTREARAVTVEADVHLPPPPQKSSRQHHQTASDEAASLKKE